MGGRPVGLAKWRALQQSRAFVAVAERHVGNDDLVTGTTLGLTGGLAGTMVMDLFGVGLFLAMGGPASLSFSIIGDAAAGFLALVGISVTGGFLLGAALHYLIGLALGALLGIARSGAATLLFSSMSKCVGLAVLYVEVMSLPMLTAAAIILGMTTPETAQWFGISFVMHLVYGLVLGVVVAYRPRFSFPAGRE